MDWDKLRCASTKDKYTVEPDIELHIRKFEQYFKDFLYFFNVSAE